MYLSINKTLITFAPISSVNNSALSTHIFQHFLSWFSITLSCSREQFYNFLLIFTHAFTLFSQNVSISLFFLFYWRHFNWLFYQLNYSSIHCSFTLCHFSCLLFLRIQLHYNTFCHLQFIVLKKLTFLLLLYLKYVLLNYHQCLNLTLNRIINYYWKH